MRHVAALLCFWAALGGFGAGVRADAIAPWDEVPSGLCPAGTRHSAHSGQCVVQKCDPASPGARCARVSLCVTRYGGRVADTEYLVADRTCAGPSDCPPPSECQTLRVMPGRDPPVTQAALGCCALSLVGAAATALVLARSRKRARDVRDPASASRDGRVG